MHSLQQERDFEKINLKQIDPTLCFRFLKGSSAPSLIELKPIPAQFTLNKKSPEQVQVIYNIEPIDNSTNLDNLGWLDFEKLMMDLFERNLDQVLEKYKSSKVHWKAALNYMEWIKTRYVAVKLFFMQKEA